MLRFNNCVVFLCTVGPMQSNIFEQNKDVGMWL